MGPPTGPAPTDSFAWKDSALDRELRAIKDKKFSDAPEPKSGRDGANDGLDKSLDRWANTPLPKVIIGALIYLLLIFLNFLFTA